MDKERELNALAEVLYILTVELKENKTFAIEDAFKYVHREIVNDTLASEAAYYDFYEKTGKDIRRYSWNGGKVKTKSGSNLNINSEYTAEHMQTAKHFKDVLLEAYERNELSVDYIKGILKDRYLCWITKEENEKLESLGFRSYRPDPYQAYEQAGIIIFHQDNQNNTSKAYDKEKIKTGGEIKSRENDKARSASWLSLVSSTKTKGTPREDNWILPLCGNIPSLAS